VSDPLAEFRAEQAETDTKAALNRTLRQLASAKAKTEDLVDAVYRAVGDALLAYPLKPVPSPAKDRRKGRAEVALWHLTDWQGAKVTPSYNSDVMRKRVHAFVDSAERITAIQREAHPIRACHILFGGDMLEGLFNFPTQPFEIDATIFTQWRQTSNLCAEVVQRALAIYEEVTVVDEWGNHGRIGSRRDAVPRSDNFDRMAYATARMIVGSQPRLTWPEPSAEDIQRVEIGNYRALLLHGDETGRAGYVSQTTFLSYLNRLKAGAYDWAFRDAYTGHYHTHDERAMADGDGAWYQTGSTESDNRYARNGLGSAAKPTQRLHFVDPEKGRVTSQWKTSQWKIWL
jgi:hypothetical protein